MGIYLTIWQALFVLIVPLLAILASWHMEHGIHTLWNSSAHTKFGGSSAIRMATRCRRTAPMHGGKRHLHERQSVGVGTGEHVGHVVPHASTHPPRMPCKTSRPRDEHTRTCNRCGVVSAQPAPLKAAQRDNQTHRSSRVGMFLCRQSNRATVHREGGAPARHLRRSWSTLRAAQVSTASQRLPALPARWLWTQAYTAVAVYTVTAVTSVAAAWAHWRGQSPPSCESYVLPRAPPSSSSCPLPGRVYAQPADDPSSCLLSDQIKGLWSRKEVSKEEGPEVGAC